MMAREFSKAPRRDICCNIAPESCAADGVGIVIYEKRVGLYQLVLTDIRKRCFNNPRGHGGDAGYLCFANKAAARRAALQLANSGNPYASLAQIRKYIRERGENAYLELRGE